jgi:hypothetical protein
LGEISHPGKRGAVTSFLYSKIERSETNNLSILLEIYFSLRKAKAQITYLL